MSTLTGLLGGGGKPTRVTSYTSGSGSFTPLSTTTSWMRVTLVGGGEGGDGARQEAYYGGPGNIEVISAGSGTGGSGGGSATYWIKANAPSYDYVVGAGGTGGTANITAPNIPATADANVYSGTAGGNTTFGSFFVSGGGTTPSTVGSVMIGLASGIGAYGQQAPGTYTGGGQGLQAIPGGYRGAGQGYPSPSSSNIAGTGGLLPGFGFQTPGISTPSVPPLNNGGTISPASPSFLNLGGGGGGPSIYGIGGNGGSVQSPYSGPTISAAAGSGYGAGGGGGGLISTGGTRLATWTGGNGGNGSGGLIIIEEFTF